MGIVIRPLEPRDVERLADLHFACAQAQPGAFMHRLGRRFFAAYYRSVIREPTTLILVADAGADGLVGFVSATLASERHFQALRRRIPQLILSVGPALLREPRLAWELFVRARSVSPGARGGGYVVSSGPRIAYWGWRPGYPAHGASTALVREVLRHLERRGASTVRLEADSMNRKVELIHRMLGARTVNVLRTRDGRERTVLEYVLRPGAGQGTG